MRSLILLLAFCNAPLGNHYTVHVDKSHLGDVVSATSDWSNAVGNKPELTFTVRPDACQCVSEYEHMICVHYVNHKEIDASGYTYRHAHNDCSDVFISDDYASWIKHMAIRHELGHAMGLEHDHPGTIMALSPDVASRVITPTDVNQFKRLRSEGDLK